MWKILMAAMKTNFNPMTIVGMFNLVTALVFWSSCLAYGWWGLPLAYAAWALFLFVKPFRVSVQRSAFNNMYKNMGYAVERGYSFDELFKMASCTNEGRL